MKTLLITISFILICTLGFADSTTGTYSSASTCYWNTASNAYADGTGDASINQSSRNFKCNYHGTGNSLVPEDSTIDGVEILIDGRRPLGCTAWGRGGARITDDGIVWSNRKITAAFPTIEQTFTLGGPTDVWGQTLTDVIINDGRFKTQLEAVGCIHKSMEVFRRPEPTDPQGDEIEVDDKHGGDYIISRIEVGEYILGNHNGELVWTMVLDKFRVTRDDYVIIKIEEFEDFSLRVTPEHPIMVNGEYKEAQYIVPGDILQAAGADITPIETVVVSSVESFSGDDDEYYDLTTSVGNFYVGGILVHNKGFKSCGFGSFVWYVDYIRPVVYYTEGGRRMFVVFQYKDDCKEVLGRGPIEDRDRIFKELGINEINNI